MPLLVVFNDCRGACVKFDHSKFATTLNVDCTEEIICVLDNERFACNGFI